MSTDQDTSQGSPKQQGYTLSFIFSTGHLQSTQFVPGNRNGSKTNPCPYGLTGLLNPV